MHASLRRFTTAGFAAFSVVDGVLSTRADGIKVKQVAQHPGVSMSYKETHLCEPDAKAWAGYVHMPSEYLSDVQSGEGYNASMFFWYVEARRDPHNAPTAIYLAGGAGQSSLYGAVSDGGPCHVLSDSNSTAPNQFTWNENVNMLYVDQPLSTGFSYSTLHRSTLDQLFLGSDNVTDTGIVPFAAYDGDDSVPEPNATFVHGILPDQDFSKIANSSALAARTLWHFAQIWFPEFPEHHTQNKRISITGNSYGGYWVPATATAFLKQNEKIKASEIDAHILPVDTILYQVEAYATLLYNNTYSLQIVPKSVYEEALNNATKPGGCRDLITQCRELGDKYDPEVHSINETVNTACLEAEIYCAQYVTGAYYAYSGRSAFDMAQLLPDAAPPSYLVGYFNREWVQEALGVSLNFTADSTAVNNIYYDITGDPTRRAGMLDIEYLLAKDVTVGLMYGDRDYRCPWLGVENLSLQANWSGAQHFRDAGYEEIRVNDTYIGGVTRQYGKLSFSRVFEAGHDLSAFQPETSARIFSRIMGNTNVATGLEPAADTWCNYTSAGPLSSWSWKNELPPSTDTACYLYEIGPTCTVDQYAALANGSAIIDGGFNIVMPSGGGGPLTNGGLT